MLCIEVTVLLIPSFPLAGNPSGAYVLKGNTGIKRKIPDKLE